MCATLRLPDRYSDFNPFPATLTRCQHDNTFSQLLTHLHRGDRFGYWWESSDKTSQWWSVDRPTVIPLAWADRNVYFNVNPSTVRRGSNQRTRIIDVAGLNCVFAELDAKDFEGSKTAILAHIGTLPQKPSVIVDSGGGYHCYWLLSETFIIDSEETRALARDVQAAWVTVVRGDNGAKDINRVLRVPGTLNHKYNPPRRVEIVHADFTSIYEWSTILALTTQGRATGHRRTTGKPHKPQERATGHRRADSIVEQVKSAYSAYNVFDRFGLANQTVEENRSNLRLLGHCGLIVGKPDSPYWWRWSIPGQGIGGDQIDAWHYCQHGRTLDRNDGPAFWKTICEMAEAAGIEIPKPKRDDPDQVRAEIQSCHRPFLHSINLGDYVPKERQTHIWQKVRAEEIPAEWEEGIDGYYYKGRLVADFDRRLLDGNGNRILERYEYRTRKTDRPIADTILDMCEEYGRFRIYTSFSKLAKRIRKNAETVKAAVERLNGWFLKWQLNNATDSDDTIVIDVARRSDHTWAVETVPSDLRATYYSANKTDDLYQSGLKTEAAKEKENDIPGLGEGLLSVVNYLQNYPGSSRSEIAEGTGMKIGTVGHLTRRGYGLGLLAWEQEHKKTPKLYSLAEDWELSLEILRPLLNTYKRGLEWDIRSLQSTIDYCNRELGNEETNEETNEELTSRRNWAQNELAKLLPQRYEWMTPADVEQWISTPNGKQAERPHSMDRPHADWMMEIGQIRRRKEAENIAQIEADLAGGFEHQTHYAMAAD